MRHLTRFGYLPGTYSLSFYPACHQLPTHPICECRRREDEKRVAARCVFASTTNNNHDAYAPKSLSLSLPFHRRWAFDPGVPLISPNASSTLWVNVLSLKWTLLTILYVSVSARVLEVRAQGLRVSKSGAEELLGG